MATPTGRITTHPGEVLQEEFLKPCGLTASWLSKELKIDAKAVYDIIKGERAITAQMALKLAKVLNTSPEFWLQLQLMFDLTKAKKEIGVKVETELRAFDMVKTAELFANATKKKVEPVELAA